MPKIARTPKTLRQSHHQIIKVLIVTGGYYDYKGEASTELFDFPTGTILHFTPTWIHWGQTVEKLPRKNILKVIMRWKCEFLNRWLLARGWQSSIPHVWVERRKSCQYFPRHLCSSHFYNTFSAPANWEKLLHFPVFLEKKVPYQNLFFKREGIVQFFILP